MEVRLSVIIEVTVLVVGLGVAWGQLHTEVEALKTSRSEMASGQAAINLKVDDLRERMIRIEDKLPARRPAAAR